MCEKCKSAGNKFISSKYIELYIVANNLIKDKAFFLEVITNSFRKYRSK